ERTLNFVADEPVSGSFASDLSEFIEPAPLAEPQLDEPNPATLEALHGNELQPPVPPLDFAEPPPIQPIQLRHPADFPREAVDALDSLDMPLPPRSEPTMSFDEPPASLATQPPAAPATKAKQPIVPPPESVDDAEEIAAGPAGTAAVARLGAMPYGSLKLDFDLELPPSPAQALPAFTKEDIAKIARNKLELASEYIELGDLSGARVLINEVIEANDAATRSEARALLSTLAPLS
ncbi:MAG TPA: FimV/HubP family polar landmark protein, partial [Paraburkholderia sp.]|nr:FimV/HubP family polar landmark protein [Paraburkholderia sp.]